MFDLLWFVFANWCFGIRACGDANTYYAFEIQGAPNRVGNVNAPSERLLPNLSMGP